jgi:hypothetical protein
VVRESLQHLSSEVLHEQEAPDAQAWFLAGGQRSFQGSTTTLAR